MIQVITKILIDDGPARFLPMPFPPCPAEKIEFGHFKSVGHKYNRLRRYMLLRHPGSDHQGRTDRSKKSLLRKMGKQLGRTPQAGTMPHPDSLDP